MFTLGLHPLRWNSPSGHASMLVLAESGSYRPKAGVLAALSELAYRDRLSCGYDYAVHSFSHQEAALSCSKRAIFNSASHAL